VADHSRAVRRHRRDVRAAVAADRADSWDAVADPATLLRRAQHHGVRLWERGPGSPWFGVVAVGVGRRPPRLAGGAAGATGREFPRTVDLFAVGVLGIADPDRAVVRWVLLQLLTQHSPADLAVTVRSADPGLRSLVDVPHADDRAAGEGRRRVVVLDGGTSPGTKASGRPDAAAPEPVEPGPGTAVLCLADHPDDLPTRCGAVVTVGGDARTPGHAGDGDGGRGGSGSSPALRYRDATTTWEADPWGVAPELLADAAAALAPLTDAAPDRRPLPDRVFLADLDPVVAGLLTDGAASSGPPPDGRGPMSVVLGVGAAGPVRIDLDAHGPHLLVAGTTGSGKSALLQTLVLGLAAVAPASHTSFLLVDYKGGAAFGPLADLPHTAGVITDLDEGLAARALVSLRAELRRREGLVRQAGHPDLVTWRAAATPPGGASAESDQGQPAVPARLVVVVDELATLTTELPDFVAGLVDVAQRGRSLGLHLVLATQRPAGVVGPAVRANITTRICLRVTDGADSHDVIGDPRAADLPTDRPGRGYLRVGSGPVVAVQTALVGASVQVPPAVRRRVDPTGAPVPATVASTIPATPTPPDTDGSPGPRALVRALQRGNAERAHRPWLPPLPNRFRATDGAAAAGAPPGRPARSAWAAADRPEQQRQDLLAVPGTSVLVVGPPGSGRTTTLRRIARCALVDLDAELVVVSTGSLTDLTAAPGASTVLDTTDPVLLVRLVALLRDRVDEPPCGTRTAAGPVGSGRPDVPAGARPLLVLVDGWEAVTAALDSVDHGVSSLLLAELAGRGPAAGVRVAASATPRAVHGRAASGFGTVLALGPPEGRPVVGRWPPGRGRLGDVTVQVADEPPFSAAAASVAGSAAPASAPPPSSGIVLRPLPVRVDATDLPPPTPATVWLGLGGDAATPVGLDLDRPAAGVLGAGPRRSGVTTTLATLAVQAVRAGLPVLRMSARPGGSIAGVTDLDLRDGTGPLRARLAAHDGPLVFLVDDPTGAAAPELSAVLLQYLAVAGSRQALVLGTRLDVARRSGRGVVGQLLAERTGVLLQPEASDGLLVDTVLPRRRPVLRPGRGVLLSDGAVVELQVTTAPPMLGPRISPFPSAAASDPSVSSITTTTARPSDDPSSNLR
jgi:S-DNA-T family DNA segregation ATPase FtsK/SpoIIIE